MLSHGISFYMMLYHVMMGVSWNRGTPSHHPFIDGIFPYKPSILDTPIIGNPHIMLCHVNPNLCGFIPLSTRSLATRGSEVFCGLNQPHQRPLGSRFCDMCWLCCFILSHTWWCCSFDTCRIYIFRVIHNDSEWFTMIHHDSYTIRIMHIWFLLCIYDLSIVDILVY